MPAISDNLSKKCFEQKLINFQWFAKKKIHFNEKSKLK